MEKYILEELKKYLINYKIILDHSCNYESLGSSFANEILDLISKLEEKYRKGDVNV